MQSSYHSFKVLGLQRSGTNWLKNLISHNFLINPYPDKIYWKHLTPLGVHNDCKRKNSYLCRNFNTLFNTQHLNLNLEDGTIFYIAVQKKIDLWCKSIHRKPVDFRYTHRCTDLSDQRRLGAKSLEEVWNSWDNWKNISLQKSNFFFKDYLCWLEDWQVLLAQIHELTGWDKRFEQWYNVKNIRHSESFDLNNYIL